MPSVTYAHTVHSDYSGCSSLSRFLMLPPSTTTKENKCFTTKLPRLTVVHVVAGRRPASRTSVWSPHRLTGGRCGRSAEPTIELMCILSDAGVVAWRTSSPGWASSSTAPEGLNHRLPARISGVSGRRRRAVGFLLFFSPGVSFIFFSTGILHICQHTAMSLHTS